MNGKLAIIIPAYKSEYLDHCLNSIASQTNKNFTLYIGNDGSPYNIDSIVDKYFDKIDIQYKKFPDNLGSTSLVKHWERCIDMIGNEDWIWLFSDDDMMDKNAVESFYNVQPLYINVYRFNLMIIDQNNKMLTEVIYPEYESSASFLNNRLSYNYLNVITNYIFSKDIYKKSNGFVDFPLAWGSDDASIIHFAEHGKIILITGSKISWRNSGTNISVLLSKEICKKKILSRIAFVKWLYTKKKYLLEGITSNREIVARWFFHGLKVEYAWASRNEKYKVCRCIFPYVGFSIFKILLVDKKNQLKYKAITFIKRVSKIGK